MNNSGFTLVELLVSIALTSIIITSLLGAFTTLIKYQSILRDEQVALDSVRFVIQEISRDLYFGINYSCGGTCSCITFTDQLNRRVKYRLNTTTNVVEKGIKIFDPNPNSCGDNNAAIWSPISNDSVNITDLTFSVSNSGQSNVHMKISASYIIEGETHTPTFSTQVTKRILDIPQSIEDTFIFDSRISDIATTYYFVYGPDPGNVSSVVCLDELNNVYPEVNGATPCDNETRAVDVEWNSDGDLYVLGANGMLFVINSSYISTISSATGEISSTDGSGVTTITTAKNKVTTSSIQSGINRVEGKDGSGTCKTCSNDPLEITSIYRYDDYLIAHSNTTGSLYKIDKSTNASAERVFDGSGLAKVEHVDATDNKLAVIFKNSSGNRIMQFHSETPVNLSESDCTTEFNYSISSFPPNNTCYVIDNNTVPSELANIQKGFINDIQVFYELLLVFFNGREKLLTVNWGIGNETSYEHVGSSDKLLNGGPLAGNGADKFIFSCENNEKLCVIHLNDLDSGYVSDLVSTTDDVGVIEKYIYDNNKVIGFNEDDDILIFSISNNSISGSSVSLYDEGKILCGATTNNSKQLQFLDFSDSIVNDRVAVVGNTFNQDTARFQNDIYLFEDTDSSKIEYSSTERNDICSSDNVERYNLPTLQGFNVDLLRIPGLSFVDSSS